MMIGTFLHEQLNPRFHAGEWLCLSLTQPWADGLFVEGLKRIETRSWRTNYRGRIYIHAAGKMPKYAKDFAAKHGIPTAGLSLGCIIGHVDLVAIDRAEGLVPRISLREIEWGNFGPRRFGWITANSFRFNDPIPARGQLGLWRFKPPAELAA